MSVETTMPSLFGRGTAVFKEHADLRPFVARLRAYATARILGQETTEFEPEALLDEFFDQLLAHFAAEEAEGYFGTFIGDHPELSAHVERLMAEHEEMVDAVERLRSLAERPSSSRDLGLGLLSLVTRFEGHEREENMLMRTFLSMPPAR